MTSEGRIERGDALGSKEGVSRAGGEEEPVVKVGGDMACDLDPCIAY